jgi:capsular exopolysaccharide synthesis family protein
MMKRVAALQFGDQKNQMNLFFAGYEELNDKRPVSPSSSKSMLIGLVLALGLAISVPIGLEFINSTISEIPLLESRLGIAGLGMVPLTNKELLEQVFRSPALGAKVPNYLLECFRVIRSHILLNSSVEGLTQVICITSAKPSEGKSTLAANLAWAFYSMGEKTLLVDTDLRRGRIHGILGLDNSNGLASYFDGSATASQIVQTTLEKNLDVITRGPFIAGASDFLCREVFEDLVKDWRKIYDRIILDGPPVLGLSETASTQRVADGVVLVVKAESTRVMDIEAAVDQLKRAGTNFFGFVLNRLDLSKMSNHYYYYYYSPNYYLNYDEESPINNPDRAI